MLSLYIGAGVVLVLLLLSLFYIKVSISLKLVSNSDNTILTMKITSIFKPLQKEYLLHDFNTILNYLDNALSKNKKKPEEEAQLPSGSYYRMFNLATRYLVVEQLDWHSYLGLNDAMYTAVGSGSLWALKGMLIGFLSSKSTLQDINIKVEPEFNEEKLVSQLYCILKMRIVHIILILVYFFFLIVRGFFNGFATGKAEPSY
jgi:hypothetical protein